MADENTGLTIRQQKFVNEYILDMNGAAAAIRAGYSKSSARQISSENLTKPNIKAAIDKKMDEMNERSILKADEVMQLLSKIAMGNDVEEQIVVEGKGAGYSEARIMERKISKSDQLKALNMLAKRFGLDTAVTEKVGTVQIVDDIGEDDED